jgi:predicted AAA+ superfamily ATPase
LLRGVTESLAGRALYYTLYPFTRRELQGTIRSLPYLRRAFENGAPPKHTGATRITPDEVLLGGFPPVCLKLTRRPAFWFKGYEQTYLERDVRELSRLVDLVSFRNLLGLAANRTGQILTISELGRDAKLNATTTARYLSVLEASFVVTRLHPYFANRASRLIKSPKLYVSDSGLAAHLVGVGETGIASEAMKGALLETYVAQNLAALLESEWTGARLSYWHVQGRYEVDFVIEKGRETLAIEIKSAARWDGRDLAGLKAFLDKTKQCRLAILAYGGSETVRLGDRLWAVPLAAVLS